MKKFDLKLKDWNILFLSSYISFLILLGPFIAYDLRSITILGIFWGLILIDMLFIGAFSEYMSTFLKTNGGIYDYIKNYYGRPIGFLIGYSFIFFLVFMLMLLYDSIRLILKDFLSISNTFLFRDIIFFVIFIILTAVFFINRSKKIFKVITTALGVIIAIFFIYLFFNSLYFASIKWPLYSNIKTSLFAVFKLIALLMFSYFPLTFLAPQTQEFDERIFDTNKLMRNIFLILTPLFLIFLYGVIKKRDLMLYNFFNFSSISFISMSIYIKIAAFMLVFFLFMLWYRATELLINQLIKDGFFFKRFKNNLTTIVFYLLGMLILYFIIDNSFSTLFYNLTIILSSLIGIILFYGIKIGRERFMDLERPYTLKATKAIIYITILFILAFFYSVYKFGLLKEFFIIIIIYYSFLILIYILFELYYNEEMASKILNIYAPLAKHIEPMLFPKKLKEEVFKKLGKLREKKVLYYGAYTGLIASDLFEAVGSKGFLYISDRSKKAISIIKKHFEEKHKYAKNVQFFVDSLSTINPAVSKVDVIVSLNSISYANNIKQLLRDMNIVLKFGGKILIIEKRRFLIFKNKWLYENKKIEKIFDDAGFGVGVEFKRFFLREYVVIFGIKFKDVYYMDTWFE